MQRLSIIETVPRGDWFGDCLAATPSVMWVNEVPPSRGLLEGPSGTLASGSDLSKVVPVLRVLLKDEGLGTGLLSKHKPVTLKTWGADSYEFSEPKRGVLGNCERAVTMTLNTYTLGSTRAHASS